MKTFALRLKPEQDLRQALEVFTQEKAIKAGFILTAIGSLKQSSVRFADRSKSQFCKISLKFLLLTEH